MRTLFWMATGAAIAMLGCGGGRTPRKQPPSAACTDLGGKTFQAVHPQECGLGLDGKVALCPWRVQFSNDAQGALTFEWYRSDVTESGRVSCNTGALTTTPRGSAPPYRGTHDPTAGTLFWEGAYYRLQR